MMDCLDKMAMSDEELLQFALDDVQPQNDAREHLEHCSACQQRLAKYQHMNSYLLAKLYRSQCPSATDLNLYCANMLSDDKMAKITYHIAECPLCTRETIAIRNVLASFEISPALAEGQSLRSTLKRIVATLVPWQPQLVTRSVPSTSQWPRQYRAGTINVSLHLSRGSGGENILLGLFTSDNPDETIEELEDVVVDLYTALAQFDAVESDLRRAPVLSTHIDDLGNVVFKAVPAGDYTMIVHLPASELVIENLTIEH